MWILEIIYKKTIKFIQKHSKKNIESINEETCEHIFLPIDSTKKILACSKCGLLIKSENLKQKIDTSAFDNLNF